MIGLIGLSHQTAMVEVREKLVISPELVSDLFIYLKEVSPITGIFALTTCNRTELYFEASPTKETEASVLEMVKIAFLRFFSSGDEVHKYIFAFSGLETAKHLFRVATGLESMILGEYQIVSQLKEAYVNMEKLGVIGPLLKRMIQKAFETGKLVRTNTNINKGFVSVSSAAVAMIGKRLGAFYNIKALSVGAGETGTIVVQNLVKKECKNVFVSNRTFQKAINLADKTNSIAIEFDNIISNLETVDVVLYSTGSKEVLLSKDLLYPVMQARNSKPLLIIDLCIPRNVDPKVSDLDGVTLIDLDHLEEVVNANFEMRKSEVGKAEEIIDKSVVDFEEWIGIRRLKCAINSITSTFKEVNSEEIGNYKKVKGNQTVKKHIAEYGDHLSAKFTRMLIKQLRDITNEGRDPEKVKIVSDLFNFNENR
ncbi:MAG: glutamyl-tRNA reductase [Marinilabiliaceae bacterium]|nr:glutamyl-tRNA reductase [Marinilabiliaceae bacterium]